MPNDAARLRTTVSAAFGAAAAATLTAVPSGDFAGYAGARLIDTLIGSALALAAGYLLSGLIALGYPRRATR